jgi:hypothetical protein
MSEDMDDLRRPGLEPSLQPPFDYGVAQQPPPPVGGPIAAGRLQGYRGPIKRLIVACDGKSTLEMS